MNKECIHAQINEHMKSSLQFVQARLGPGSWTLAIDSLAHALENSDRNSLCVYPYICSFSYSNIHICLFITTDPFTYVFITTSIFCILLVCPSNSTRMIFIECAQLSAGQYTYLYNNSSFPFYQFFHCLPLNQTRMNFIQRSRLSSLGCELVCTNM